MVIRKGISLLFWFLPVVVFSQPSWLLHQSYALKYYYIDSMLTESRQENKGGLLDSLVALSNWASKQGDKELSYLFKMERLKFIIENTDSAKDEMEAQLFGFENDEAYNRYKYCHAELLQSLGLYYWNRKNNPAAGLEYYLEAHKLYSGFSPNDFPPKREYLNTLGTAFYVYDDYEHAITYLNEAVMTPPSKHRDPISSIYTTLGLCYRYLNKYDSSNYYFNLVYSRNDPAWRALTAGNIGINYFYQKRYDDAIPLLEEEINTSFNRNNNIRSAANSLYILSCIYYERNNLDKAEEAVKKALDACEKKRFWPDYLQADHFFTQLYKIYNARQDYRLAALYADSAIMAKDSAHAQYNALKLLRAKEKDEIASNKLQQEQLKNQRDIQSIVRNSLVAVILLLMFIGILFVNRQRLKQNKLYAEKKNAEAELNAAVAQLDAFKNSVQEKNVLIEHFSTEMEKIKQGEQEKADNELVSRLERSIILTDEQWEEFRVLFEKVHRGFFAALKKKIPDLTQSEIRFLALTKLKLTTKEMASMLGISAATIRSYRHRLRKKLDMDKDGLIGELIDDI